MAIKAAALRMDRPAVVAAALGLLLAPVVALGVVASPKLAIGAVLGLGLFSVLVWRPVLGAALTIGGIMFSEVYVPAGFARLTIGDLTMFAFLGAWGVHRALRMEAFELPPRFWLLGGFLTVCLASMLSGVNPAKAYGAFGRVTCYVLMIVPLVDVLRTRQHLKMILWVLCLAGLGQCVISLAIGVQFGRLVGLADQPNVLGTRLAIGTLATFALFGLTPKLAPVRRLLLLGISVLGLLCVVLTVSRGTTVALGIATIWWMRRHRSMIFIGIAAAAIPFFISSSSSEFIGSRWQMEDSSIEERLGVYRNGLKAFAENPILGVGFAQFDTLHESVEITSDKQRGAHNFYLGYAASLGLPAMLLFFGFVGSHLRRIWASHRLYKSRGDAEAAALLAAFQALSIYQIFELFTRGGEPMFVVGYLGFYIAAGRLAGLEGAQDDETPAVAQPAPEPSGISV